MRKPMDIIDSTRSFEKWKGTFIPLDSKAMELKHHQMAESPYCHFRATFYHWMLYFFRICGSDAVKAPEVLAIADWAITNMGTFHDGDSNLVLGANDVDEAFWLV